MTDLIERELFGGSVVEKMDEFAIYFKVPILKTLLQKKLPFPIKMGNRFDAAGVRVTRTTNSVKSWHYGLQAYSSGSSLNIRLLLRNLEKDSETQNFIFFRKTAGLLCSKHPRYWKQMEIFRSSNDQTPLRHSRENFELKVLETFVEESSEWPCLRHNDVRIRDCFTGAFCFWYIGANGNARSVNGRPDHFKSVLFENEWQ